jgi:hypothetical protein
MHLKIICAYGNLEGENFIGSFLVISQTAWRKKSNGQEV